MQLVGTTANGNVKTLTNLQQLYLYTTALYIAVTLCITVTEQLPKKIPIIFTVKLTCIKRSPVYNRRGHPLYFLNPQFHCLLPVYNGQEIVHD